MSDARRDHSATPMVGPTFLPMAEGIPNPEDPIPLPPGLLPPFPQPFPPFPTPPLHLCRINLPQGCYHITFKPPLFRVSYAGTMRVESTGSTITMSGDLYRFFLILFPPIHPPLSMGLPDPHLHLDTPADAPLDIPVYPRNKYYSYLKVTNIQKSPLLTHGPCQLTLTIDEYVYNQPAAGSFNGSFPSTPSRTVTVVLSPATAPPGFTSSYFEGKLSEGGVEKGSFTMGWVSPFFRRATIRVSSVAGTTVPSAVPASSGTGNEDFTTVFATAGWKVTPIYDTTTIPIPAGTTTLEPGVCPSAADLHALMSTIHTPAPHLDQDWLIHLLVVPGKMGCGRGVMFDQIGAQREGVASFCDDGYPTGDSTWFGTAANQQQKQVPRAFLRSASHELGHGFNQIHQENEAGGDNSIMTTTPGVANTLQGPTTGAAGIFPDNINLGFNNHVRHHLIHFPDPAVRPGAMSFGAGHSTSVPENDVQRVYFDPEQLALTLTLETTRLKLAEPLPLSWQIVNHSTVPIPVPSDLRVEALHTRLTVVNPLETAKPMPPFVIRTDTGTLEPLKPGETREASALLFWGSNGFAFERPGKHQVEARVVWTYRGIPYGVQASADVWVDFPTSEADNEVAATLLHDEVGKFVALGGGASHLKQAVVRIEGACSRHTQHPVASRLMELGGHKHSKGK